MIEAVIAVVVLVIGVATLVVGIPVGRRYVDKKLRYEQTYIDPTKPIISPSARNKSYQA